MANEPTATTVLGKVSITPRGDFVLGTTYRRLDTVYDHDLRTSYLCTKDHVNEALDNTDVWMTMAYGAMGKSAYETAVEAGYLGTEPEFYTELYEVTNNIQKAKDATAAAIVAKQEADTATANAAAATAAADTATAAANTATEHADLATDNANTAADLANEKATLAQEKADLADTATEHANAAADLAEKISYIGDDGYWYVWNSTTSAYEKTPSKADGNTMFATFSVDPLTGLVTMTTPDEYKGANFAINDCYLEVMI